MKQDQAWTLAPAYDICYAYDPESIWVSQHVLSINGKRKNQVKEDFLSIAKSMNIKKAKSIIQEIFEVVCNWKFYADQVEVDPKKRKAIAGNFIRI